MTTDTTPAPTPNDARDERARRQRWLWALGGVLLVAACVARIVIVRGGDTLAEATLADGTILRLEAVTFGAKQKLIIQPQSSKVLTLLNFQQYQPEISASAEFGEVFPKCGVWLTRRDPQTGAPLDLDWLSHCTAIDADGWESVSVSTGRCHWTTAVPTNPYEDTVHRDRQPFQALPSGSYQEIVAGAFLPLFTPQAGRFRLNVYDTENKVVATFDAPYSPEPQQEQKQQQTQQPNWAPMQLPATQSSGDLEVTLERVGWTSRPTDLSVAEQKLPTLQLKPQATIRWQGQPSDDWKLITENCMVVEDGLGNLAFMDKCRLTPHVSAWKLTCLLWRKPEGRFEPHEEWDSGAIEIPAAAESRALDLVGDVQGASVQVLKVFGPGNHQFTLAEPLCLGQITPPIAQTGAGWKASAVHTKGQVDWTVESERPFVVWKQSPGQPSTLLSRAFDSGGAQLGIDEVGDYSYMNNTTIVLFKETPASGSFSLRPGKSDMRNVSFLIEPLDADAESRDAASVVDDAR